MLIKIAVSIMISFGISVLLCPIVIPFLKKLKFGQQVREEGPCEHLKKMGTPTMGGLIILSSIMITEVFFLDEYKKVLPVLFLTLGFGLIGFLDDYLKIIMKRSLGLRAWQKMFLQIIVTLIFCVYVMNDNQIQKSMLVPFTGGFETGRYINIGYLFIPMMFFVIIGTVNGANFTDGLDGLATGVTIMIVVFYTVVSYVYNMGMEYVCAAVLGSLLGFLMFNVYPARVFMGDTGSLALGGFVSAVAYMMGLQIYLMFIAIIYVIEVLSVIIQVSYFKITKGKRIFKMAPIHHHLELKGWSETRVVTVFSTITALMCMIAYLGL